jgi:hypothetical protein
MLVVGGVEEKRRNELTLTARLGLPSVIGLGWGLGLAVW